MPLYEFECADCGKEFETLVLDPDEAVKCLNCESENISKQFSTFGFGSAGGSSDFSEAVDSGCCGQSSCGCC